VDPRELLPLPIPEGHVEEGLTPSPVVCPAGLSSTCTRRAIFTNVVKVVKETFSEVDLHISAEGRILGMRPTARNVIIVA
jgi:hypothetical protein